MMNRSEAASALDPSECDSLTVNGSLSSTLLLSLLPGLGPRTLHSLLQCFGSAEAVLSAAPDELGRVSGVGPKLVSVIRTADHYVDLESILRWCRDHDVRVIRRGEGEYPSLLDQLPDAPPILFVRGTLAPRDQIAVAVVGTRHATAYGLKQAYRLAFALGQSGVTIVSGLARGIDAAAHRGSLEAGGRTIAVLGSGMAQLYPPEHRDLSEAIAEQGAVITEYSPLARPRSGMFPQRNRLVSGLALATFVVEAPERSGALITARLATEQNRDVLAMPGPITSRASRGCNQLIRDGAKLVQSVDDILEELGPLHRPIELQESEQVRNGSELTLNEIERQVLSAISPAGSLVDQVIQTSRLPASRVIAAISVLEMRHLVRRLSGQKVVRK